MSFSIKDPLTGARARVSAENRLLVESIIETDEHETSKDGKAYMLNITGSGVNAITPIVAGTYALVFTNTGADDSITITKIIAGASAAGVITMVIDRNPTLGTITNANTATAVNSNWGSTQTADMTASVWNNGASAMGGVTAGTKWASHVLGAAPTAFPIDGAILVEPGNTFGIYVVGNASATMTCNLRFYFD